MKEVTEKLQNVFRDVFDNPDIVLRDDMTAKDVEGWDSLNHILLVVAVETDFGITFETAEISELKNVGDFIKLIQRKLNK
jgi:acyl carrier protein